MLNLDLDSLSDIEDDIFAFHVQAGSNLLKG